MNIRQTITAVIPTLNEEHNIERAIKSVLWCDKILVVDSGSEDKTVQVAQKLGAITHVAHKGELFAGVQENINWANDHCGTDWILRIDADEEVTSELRAEIQQVLTKKGETVAYGIPRRQFFLGGFLKGGDWAYDRLVRLYRPTKARFERIVSVHEQFIVHGKQDVLHNYINHYSHPTWKEIHTKWELYTDLEIKDMHISMPVAFIKMLLLPFYVFIRWMIKHHGWKDGLRGVVAGVMRGYYDYLKFSKYLINSKKK